jgi:ubiquinone/menaquinone biosynthesis C-methylase UbiE
MAQEAQMNGTETSIPDAVREHYGGFAAGVLDADAAPGGCGQPGCCSGSGCCGDGGDTISVGLYEEAELGAVPLKAALASLGCGNPTAVAELHPGEVVLDLGSGGGIDVLLSAKRVGPGGFAYGLDMTDEMLELARRNAAEAGVDNVEFLKGDIAAIPLPDNMVDVILSNCVINLAEDKRAVFAEALRVLKPGGRLAVSDIVIHGGLPAELGGGAELRRDLSSWAGCIAGALTDAEYEQGLAAAGFREVSLEVTRRYSAADLGQPLPAALAALGAERAEAVAGRFAATTVRARKAA